MSHLSPDTSDARITQDHFQLTTDDTLTTSWPLDDESDLSPGLTGNWLLVAVSARYCRYSLASCPLLMAAIKPLRCHSPSLGGHRGQREGEGPLPNPLCLSLAALSSAFHTLLSFPPPGYRGLGWQSPVQARAGTSGETWTDLIHIKWSHTRPNHEFRTNSFAKPQETTIFSHFVLERRQSFSLMWHH